MNNTTTKHIKPNKMDERDYKALNNLLIEGNQKKQSNMDNRTYRILMFDRLLHAVTIGLAAYFINQLIGKL